MKHNKTKKTVTSGMTLPEVMIAAFISVGVLGGAVWFLLQGARISYRAMADVENGIQQWGLTTKLQIDGKVANGATIIRTLEFGHVDYLKIVPIDDGDKTNGLERGNVLVLTKSQLNQGVDTGVITDMIVYIFTPGSAPKLGSIKRFPANSSKTHTLTNTEAIDQTTKTPKTVATLIDENRITILAGAKEVQNQLLSLSGNDGPFASFGGSNHVSIAVLREEAVASITRSILTEVSFNLR